MSRCIALTLGARLPPLTTFMSSIFSYAASAAASTSAGGVFATVAASVSAAASAAAAAFFQVSFAQSIGFCAGTKTNRLHARAKLANLDNLVMRFQKSLTRHPPLPHPPPTGEIAELVASADIYVRCVTNFQ